MVKLIYLIGLPGSGKSTFVEKIAKKEKAEVVSSDSVRQEKYFDRTKQKNPGYIFRMVYTKVEEILSEGRSAIIDATNIEREKREKFINKFDGIEKECYYLDVPYEKTIERNNNRKRTVPERIMKRMRLKLDFPYINEGWDNMHFVHESSDYGISKEEFISLIKEGSTYDKLFNRLKSISIFNDIYRFNQENPYHSMPLCEHTYSVLEYVNEEYGEDDKLALQLAALFHDIGKPFCKVYKQHKGYYSYYGHEKVSAQIACHFLNELGFEKDFVLKTIGLIEMHMKIAYGGESGASEIYHLLGDENLWKLYFFNEADRYAK
ncbi:AAA family ATPase [Bacillus spongiae]|uniref:AAA family ATPase n=1 Tax=Bacillus spongiae TaxID=2683610 RepID=A0ABU8HBV2_9BACI